MGLSQDEPGGHPVGLERLQVRERGGAQADEGEVERVRQERVVGYLHF